MEEAFYFWNSSSHFLLVILFLIIHTFQQILTDSSYFSLLSMLLWQEMTMISCSQFYESFFLSVSSVSCLFLHYLLPYLFPVFYTSSIRARGSLSKVKFIILLSSMVSKLISVKAKFCTIHFPHSYWPLFFPHPCNPLLFTLAS